MSNTVPAKIRERMNPQIWESGYLVLKHLFDNLKSFSEDARNEGAEKMLDLGCGVKPYESLFSFCERFVGFDIEKNGKVDVVGYNWDLPFADNEFDALISTQVLEHTAKIPETIHEMRRVVKNGGLIFISVPLAYPEHGAPYDFYRFTKYGLMEVFKDFEILKIDPQGGYMNTLIRLWNVFLDHLPGSRYWLAPVFLVNNVLAILLDECFRLVGNLHPRLRQIYKNSYMNFPENYVIILRNRK